MSKLSLKEKILYGVLGLVGIASLYGMFVTSTTFYKQRDKLSNSPTTQAHDETNSDGHHNSDNSDLGEVADFTDQTEVAMNIKDFKYEKPNIKIKKGTTVTWTNQDATAHNVMQEHQNDNDAHDAPSKDEEKPDVLASRLLSKGESYSYTFNEVSTDPYHCSPHPYMKGSVTVVE